MEYNEFIEAVQRCEKMCGMETKAEGTCIARVTLEIARIHIMSTCVLLHVETTEPNEYPVPSNTLYVQLVAMDDQHIMGILWQNNHATMYSCPHAPVCCSLEQYWDAMTLPGHQSTKVWGPRNPTAACLVLLATLWRIEAQRRIGNIKHEMRRFNDRITELSQIIVESRSIKEWMVAGMVAVASIEEETMCCEPRARRDIDIIMRMVMQDTAYVTKYFNNIGHYDAIARWGSYSMYSTLRVGNLKYKTDGEPVQMIHNKDIIEILLCASICGPVGIRVVKPSGMDLVGAEMTVTLFGCTYAYVWFAAKEEFLKDAWMQMVMAYACKWDITFQADLSCVTLKGSTRVITLPLKTIHQHSLKHKEYFRRTILYAPLERIVDGTAGSLRRYRPLQAHDFLHMREEWNRIARICGICDPNHGFFRTAGLRFLQALYYWNKSLFAHITTKSLNAVYEPLLSLVKIAGCVGAHFNECFGSALSPQQQHKLNVAHPREAASAYSCVWTTFSLSAYNAAHMCILMTVVLKAVHMVPFACYETENALCDLLSVACANNIVDTQTTTEIQSLFSTESSDDTPYEIVLQKINSDGSITDNSVFYSCRALQSYLAFVFINLAYVGCEHHLLTILEI